MEQDSEIGFVLKLCFALPSLYKFEEPTSYNDTGYTRLVKEVRLYTYIIHVDNSCERSRGM